MYARVTYRFDPINPAIEYARGGKLVQASLRREGCSAESQLREADQLFLVGRAPTRPTADMERFRVTAGRRGRLTKKTKKAPTP